MTLDLARVALVDVDTQVDFIEPGGRLYAKGAERVKPNLARLVAAATELQVTLVSSVDAHAPGDPELSTYPPHCLAGTPGQKKLAETTTGREVFVPSRRQTTLPDPRAAHVVLEKQVFPLFGNENADAVLAATGATTFYVFGVVTEVCVKAAADGLLDRGHEVRLVEDAIAPLDAAQGEAVKAALVARGAALVTTEQALAELRAARGARTLAGVEVVRDRTAEVGSGDGFLRVRRLKLRNRWSDGTVSREYSCDVCTRASPDAVAVALYHRRGGEVFVHLRVAPRAAAWLRRERELPRPDARPHDHVVEVVAGLLEPGDRGPGAVERRAAAEALEEAGFTVDPAKVAVLGEGFFSTPGMTDEKIHVAAVEVDPASAGHAQGDGSVMEEGATIAVLELGQAIAACRRGAIADAKTEVALARLASHLGYVPELGLTRDALPPELRARWRGLGLPGGGA